MKKLIGYFKYINQANANLFPVYKYISIALNRNKKQNQSTVQGNARSVDNRSHKSTEVNKNSAICGLNGS